MASVGHAGMRRISRIVTLPDYQGVGIGKALLNFVAEKYKQEGIRMTIGTSHPAMVQSLQKSKDWTFRKTQETLNVGDGSERTKKLRKSVVIGRKVAYFEYGG
jgi:GNAT superfamily N-acetyltransferase